MAENKPNILFQLFIGASNAVIIIGPVIGLLVLGLWLDGLFGTSPILVIVGVLIAIAISVRNLLNFRKTLK